MKNYTRILLLSIFSVVGYVAFAQNAAQDLVNEAPEVSKRIDDKMDTAKWDWGGTGAFQFGQTELVNWASGGNSQISFNLRGFFFANLKKRKHVWENSIEANWGIIKLKREEAQINQNLFTINSKYGYQLAKRVFFSALLNIQSPISNGFDYAQEPKQFITTFAAPMYIKTSVGIDFRITDYFTIFLSPVAGKFTIVGSDSIANLNRYIPLIENVKTGNPYYNKHFRAEFGAMGRISFQKEVFKNVSVRSVFEVFNNYTDINKQNRKNFDIDWQTGIDLKVNDWLAIGLFLHLIYDNDINWAKYEKDGTTPVYLKRADGSNYLDADGNPIQQFTSGTQFKEAFNLGLTYTFGSDKIKEQKAKKKAAMNN